MTDNRKWSHRKTVTKITKFSISQASSAFPLESANDKRLKVKHFLAFSHLTFACGLLSCIYFCPYYLTLTCTKWIDMCMTDKRKASVDIEKVERFSTLQLYSILWVLLLAIELFKFIFYMLIVIPFI